MLWLKKTNILQCNLFYILSISYENNLPRDIDYWKPEDHSDASSCDIVIFLIDKCSSSIQILAFHGMKLVWRCSFSMIFTFGLTLRLLKFLIEWFKFNPTACNFGQVLSAIALNWPKLCEYTWWIETERNPLYLCVIVSFLWHNMIVEI